MVNYYTFPKRYDTIAANKSLASVSAVGTESRCSRMTLQECYINMGGDYDAVMGRLRSEERVTKFLGLFGADESFQSLSAAMGADDWTTAFRAAHSLKGVALNLGLTALAQSSSDLTECLRPGTPAQDPAPLYAAVRRDYEKAIAAIDALKAQA